MEVLTMEVLTMEVLTMEVLTMEVLTMEVLTMEPDHWRHPAVVQPLRAFPELLAARSPATLRPA
jgi:hypothetical protein